MAAVKPFRKTFRTEPNVSLQYTIKKGVESVLFNDKDLNIFKIKIEKELSKVNALQSVIDLEEQLFYIVVII